LETVTDMTETEREDRLAHYQAASTIPLLVTGFVYLGSFIAYQIDDETATAMLFTTAWALFMVDYAIQIILAPRKWRFVVGHPLYLLSLVMPPVRIWLLLAIVFRLVRNSRSSLRKRAGLLSLVAVAMIIVFGGLLTLTFEEGRPGANIETYGESLWWATVTLTTVGYGEYYPISTGGRLTGIAVISIGLATVAVLTATIVGMFTQTSRGVPAIAPSATPESEGSSAVTSAELPGATTQLKSHASPTVPQGNDDLTEVGGSAKDSQFEAVMAKLEEINTRLTAIEESSDNYPGTASPKLSD
jgi:voltage-gated potassium channel